MSRSPRVHAVWIAVLVGVVSLAVLGIVAATGAGDDNVPGVPLPASPVAGTLDDHTDFDDVFSVPLNVNEKLEVSMTGDSTGGFDVWLWSPSTRSVFTDSPASRVVQSSQSAGTSTERFWYPARNAGTYYLHVFNPLDGATSSKGSYNLSYKVTQLAAPGLSVKAPAVVSWGKTASITGTATLAGAPMGGARILVQSMPAGASTWRDLNFDSVAYRPKTVADAAGGFSYSVKPGTKTRYRVFVWPTENSGWKFGSPVTISPKVRLGSPRVPSSVKRRTAFTAYGYLAPRHATGAKTVTLSFEKGATKLRVKAVNSKYSSASWGRASKYRARVSLPSRGRWRVVATTPADALHAATSSSVRYITVK